MGEQRELLEGMLAQAEISVKELGERAAELETRQDMVGLEGTVLEVVLRLGAAWLGMVLSHWAGHLAEKAHARRPCTCKGVARWVEWRTKTVLTLLGRVTYRRVYFHCKQCKQGEGLGDREWGLHKTRTSLGVKQLLGYLSGTTVGFVVVARNVCRTLRWPEEWLSGKQVQRLAEPIGKLLGEQETARVAKWWAMATAGLSASMGDKGDKEPQASESGQDKAASKTSERLYVQLDGILGRIRGAMGKGSDVWREVKIGAVFWAEPGRHASTLAELLDKAEVTVGETARVWVDRPKAAITYVATLLPAAQFGIRLYAEAATRGLERAAEVVVLGDGALWIWKLAEEHFPEATQILDFHHAREWIRKVAHAVWGEGSAKARQWADTQITDHLIRGDAEGLLAAIAALPKIAPSAGQSKSIPEQAIEYFQHNAERMRYPEYRARGLEIGSGIVESAGRRVVGVRCKQPGMRWTEEGLGSIVDLRTHVLNNRYDSALADLPKAA
jgi:hypothetical protein